MGIRRAWAFLLAAAALVLFVVGLFTALAPPAPDCGDPVSVYCLEEGYSRLRLVILGSWLSATALLGVAMWILFAARGAPPPKARTVPVQTRDGRRIVTAAPGPRDEPPVRSTGSTGEARRPTGNGDRSR